MAKGIKKFDQEIRVSDGWLSIQNSGSTALLTPADYGAFYVYNDLPYYANSASTYQLASGDDVQAISGATITISGDTGSDTIGLWETLTFTGGANISVAVTGNMVTINTVATPDTNYYLSAATIDANALITFVVTGASDVTLDLKDKISLNQLSDVTAETPVDGDYLIYNSTTSLWESTTVTESSLVAGSGITFDTSSVPGSIIIESSIYNSLSAGTWSASNGTTSEVIGLNETVIFSGGTSIDVTYSTATNTFTFNSTYVPGAEYTFDINGNTIASGTDFVISGKLNEIVIANATSTGLEIALDSAITTSINNAFTGVSFDSLNDIELLTFYTKTGTVTQSLNNVWVRKDGDTMSGNLLINANLSVTGQTTIYGDLYVSGTTTTLNTENLTVADNIIELNSNETGAGVTRGSAGLIIDRGTALAYTIVFEESSDTFRIGETTSNASAQTIDTSNTQAVATREDTPNSYGIAYWSGTDERFNTTSTPTVNNSILSWNNTTSTWFYTTVDALTTDVYSWSTIVTDSGNATTTSSNQSLSILGGAMISTSVVSNNISIDHDTVTYTAPATATNTFITTLTVDSYGHISGAGTSTVDFSAYYTSVETDANFLSANTAFFNTISAETGSRVATVPNDTMNFIGANGITTSIVGNVLTITGNGDDLQHNTILGGTSTTLSDVVFTGALVVIIDYLIDGTTKQSGQLRYLVSEDIITNEYQGSLDLSFSDASISGANLILTHDNSTDAFKYFVKIIK